MTRISIIQQELEQARTLLDSVLKDPDLLTHIEKASEALSTCLAADGKILSCGNGGSHCDAMHFAEEMTGKFRDERKPLPAIAISDSSHLTCVGNDYGFENIFSRYVEGLGRPGDVLLAISTSGNSVNILRAVEEAKRKGMTTIGLLGGDGGKMKNKVDIPVVVPHQGYSDRIQEVHIKIIHIFILLTEQTVI